MVLNLSREDIKEKEKSYRRYIKWDIAGIANHYVLYPFKKQSKVIYVKQDELSDHRFALSFEEYREIYKEFSKIVEREVFYEGKRYVFGNPLGSFYLKRHKLKSKQVYFIGTFRKLKKLGLLDEHVDNFKEFVMNHPKASYKGYYNTGGYSLRLFWTKRFANVKFVRFWRMAIGIAAYRKIIKHYSKNVHEISKLRDL